MKRMILAFLAGLVKGISFYELAGWCAPRRKDHAGVKMLGRRLIGLLLAGLLLSGCVAAVVALDVAFGAAGLWQREQHRRELEQLRKLQERRQAEHPLTPMEGSDGD
ncbi:MAG: hypothetical protein HY323_09050 [Betaproteobacteria bacterium]|nr:hypothetical protein [Betaproteobacteria bacterium]